MLARSGEERDSARVLATRSAWSERRGMLWCAAYAGDWPTDIEKGFDVLGLPSRGAEGKPNGDPSWVETGESVSVAD